MTPHKRVLILFISMITSITLPMVALVMKLKGDIPDTFFVYPALTASPKPGFSLPWFLALLGGAALISLFFVFPRLFGFKKPVTADVQKKKAGFPGWFYAGLALHVVSLVLLWGKFEKPGYLVHFTLTPLWWGFVLVLDGIVYRRTGGRSIAEDRPMTLIAMGFASSVGWALFEYLNYFVDLNWYFPLGGIINPTVFYTYALIGASAFWPLIAEWYSLLSTIGPLKQRYSKGWKLDIPRPVLIAIAAAGFLSMFLVVYFPNQLFFIIWLGPLLVMFGLLPLLGYWTPFSTIPTRGDWSRLVLISLAAFIQGFCWEFWNFFSVSHCPEWYNLLHCAGAPSNNPAYWEYSIPYVSVLHIFEMPALGYFGYMPFGVFFWFFWLTFANLQGMDDDIDVMGR